MVDALGPRRPSDSTVAHGWFFLALLLALSPQVALAQTATYYLHTESSTNPLHHALKPAGPDAPAVVIQSPDLKKLPPGSTSLRFFETLAGVPGTGGTIPGNSTVTVTLWVRKTANFGVIRPWGTVSVGGTSLCQAIGAPLTTTVTAQTFQCTTSAPVSMTTSAQVLLVVGYQIVETVGNKSVKVELSIEGSFDSRITVPVPTPPSITNLQPTSAPIGAAVQITGTGFGASQGTSLVKFNGVQAGASTWSDTASPLPCPPVPPQDP